MWSRRVSESTRGARARRTYGTGYTASIAAVLDSTSTENPAPVEGRMIRSLEEGLAPGAPDQAREMMLGMIPSKRYGAAAEVASLMLFLASDESRYCTSGVYPVDGGMSAA